MRRRLEIHSLAILALVIAFDWFFEFTKHNPELKSIIPFGEDPYDAAGSYCLIVSTLLAALCFVRALWSIAMKPVSGPRLVFLARTQLAIALGILVTIGMDAVALTRHASQWFAKAAASELLALLGGMAALAFAVLLLAPKLSAEVPVPQRLRSSKRAAITIAVSLIAMFLFPDNRIGSLPIHLLAILLGSVIVAADQTALATTLIPYDSSEKQMQSSGRGRADGWILWPLIALAGAVIGAVALAAEFRESGMGHRTLPLIVMLVYVGAGMSCLLVAFAFLRRPLGLSLRSLI
jgi:hypothetical protein